MAPPARTITVALDMSKAFDTINIHTLIRKMLQTKIPGTIIKFIANYIKRRKAYTTYRKHNSSQRQFKTGVPQVGVLSPTLFNIYTADIPPPRALGQVMAYADDITITSTHTSTSTAKKYKQPYLHKVFAWTKYNNLTLNPDIHITSVQAHTPIQMIKTLAVTGWCKQKETLMATYKAVMKPGLEYASSIWSPLVSLTSINKLRTATGCTQT